MNTERSRLLMVLLGALLAVRFIFLPWWEYQREKIDSLQIVTERLDKSEAVLRYRAPILASAGALEKEMSTVLGAYPKAADDEAFRLSRQQEVTEQLQAKGLRLSVFDWTLAGDLEGTSLRFSRFRLQSTGDVANVARFISALEASAPSLYIRDLIVTPRNPLQNGAPGASVEFSLVVDAYFQPSLQKSVNGAP